MEVKGDGGRFEGGRQLVRVDLDEADDGFNTGGEGNVPDKIGGEELHDGFSENGNGSFAESCGHGVSKDEGLRRGAMRNRVEEGLVGVGESELLLEEVFRVFE